MGAATRNTLLAEKVNPGYCELRLLLQAKSAIPDFEETQETPEDLVKHSLE